MKRTFVAAVLSLTSTLRAEQAAPAAAFVDSIGVCTHWNYYDTTYGHYDELRNLIVASGIRHLRDCFHEDRLPDLASHGIATCVLSEPDFGTPEAFVAKVAAMNKAHPGAIDALEGPNEPDLFWDGQKKSYGGNGWQQGQNGIMRGVIAYQRDLYRTVKANPATSTLTVIGPSLGKTYDYDHKSPLGVGTLTDSVDLGNFHPYPGGNPFSFPFSYAGIEKYLANGTQPSANLDEARFGFDVYGPPFDPKPMAATETGYSTNTGQSSVEAHARYVPRLFAEYFRLGIKRTYLYELVDESDHPDDREANFGLIRHDLSPKPAYVAMKNLIALLNEPAANPPSAQVRFTPASIDVAVKVSPPAGYDRVQYVHHLLLQKRSGEFCLLLWHEIALEDSSSKPFRQIRHPDMPATVTLPPNAKTATVSRPNDGTASQTLHLTNGSFFDFGS